MLTLDAIATQLFNKIRSRFEVTLSDENSKDCFEPEKARTFNFVYSDKYDNEFGNVTINLPTAKPALKIIFGKNLTADLDEVQKTEWYGFLEDMKKFARRNLLPFDVQDITRERLSKKDYHQQATVNHAKKTDASSVSESRAYGNTKKIKYETIGSGTRLRIIYSDSIDETMGGRKSQKIHNIYVEDGDGQRFKVSTPTLSNARAIGRHIAEGGNIGDEFSKHITELAGEMNDLKKFSRVTRAKTFENDEADELVSAAKHRYHDIRHILNRIQNKRGYEAYKETFDPTETIQDDVDVDALRKKFTTSNFDSRLEPGLVHAARARNRTKSSLDRDVDSFAESLNSIVEGTWEVPDSDLDIKHLQELLSSELQAGVDGTNAIAALQEILNDDDLFDHIYDTSLGSPEMDVRPMVMLWLENNMPSVSAKLSELENTEQEPEEPEEQPAPPAPPAQPAQEAPPPEAPPAEEPAPGAEGEAPAPAPGAEGEAGAAPPPEEEEPAPQPQQPQPQMQSGHRRDTALLDDIRRLAGLK